MSEAKKAKSGGERMRKYREENKLRNELSNVKQQVRRSLILASGTPEADRMKKEAADDDSDYDDIVDSSMNGIHGQKVVNNPVLTHGFTTDKNRRLLSYISK